MVGCEIVPDRRRPGRLAVDLGREPSKQLEFTIRAYGSLIDCLGALMEEVPGSPFLRTKLEKYRAQFEAQLAHWAAVASRAEAIVAAARR